jgi:hypothetical protein
MRRQTHLLQEPSAKLCIWVAEHSIGSGGEQRRRTLSEVFGRFAYCQQPVRAAWTRGHQRNPRCGILVALGIPVKVPRLRVRVAYYTGSGESDDLARRAPSASAVLPLGSKELAAARRRSLPAVSHETLHGRLMRTMID